MSKYEQRHHSPDSSSIVGPSEDTLLSNEFSMPSHKRRHSVTAAAIYQSTTTQKITTTTTKTKTKLCEADSTSSTTTATNKYNPFANRMATENHAQNLAPFSNDGKEFFYHGKEALNEMSSAYNRNLLEDFYMFQTKNDLINNEEEEDDDNDDGDEEEEEENNYMSDSDDTSDSDNNDTIEKGQDKYEEEEEEEDNDDEDDVNDDDEDGDENDEELEEVEGERRWISDHHENIGIEFAIKKDIVEYVNEDEQERCSQFKVIKEFEKTMEFVKNASSLKVMNTQQIHSSSSSNSSSSTANGMPLLEGNDTNFSSLKAPHISFASLCYDQQSSLNNKKNLDSGKFFLEIDAYNRECEFIRIF
jgi:hypothetical protein